MMADFTPKDNLKAADVALSFAEAELAESTGAATPRAAAFLMSAQSSIENADVSPLYRDVLKSTLTAAVETRDDPRSHVAAARSSLNEALSSLDLIPVGRRAAARSGIRAARPASLRDLLLRSYRIG